MAESADPRFLPMVSVAVPTRQSLPTIVETIASIQSQSYPNLEVIVVDNSSSDATVEVARKAGCRTIVGRFGERSAQLNAAIAVAKGEYFYRVDADFLLEPQLIEEAVRACEEQKLDAILIHNTSDEHISVWAQARKLERDMYRDDWLNVAARFVRIDFLKRIDGFDENLVAGEDYDLHRRLLASGARIGRIKGVETHIGEPRSLGEVWTKHFYYGRTIGPFLRKHGRSAAYQLSPARPALGRHWRDLLKEPRVSAVFALYQAVKYSAGLAGLLAGVIEAGPKPDPPIPSRAIDDRNETIPQLVQVIVVAWNSGKDLASCVNQLTQSIPAAQIWVVDNASTDGCTSGLPQDVHVVHLSRNEGFGRAINSVLPSVSRDFLLVLNPDVRMNPSSLTPLLSCFRDPRVAAVQPLLVLPDGRIDSAGSFLTWSGFLLHTLHGSLQGPSKRPSSPDIFAAKGAALVLRTAAVREVGGFDPSYFLYFEDSDLSWRLWLRGWRVLLHPDVQFIHLSGASTKQLPSSLIDYHSFRNRIATLFKNLSASRLVLVLPVHLASCFIVACVYVVRGRASNAHAIMSAIGWNLTHLPRLLSARSAVQQNRLCSDAALFRLSYERGIFFSPARDFVRAYLERW